MSSPLSDTYFNYEANIMKKRIALLAGILTVGMLSVLPASAAETSYTDVPADSWYGEAVNYAVENGLFTGTSDTTFDPNGTMTRGMFVTALGVWRAFQLRRLRTADFPTWLPEPITPLM